MPEQKGGGYKRNTRRNRKLQQRKIFNLQTKPDLFSFEINDLYSMLTSQIYKGLDTLFMLSLYEQQPVRTRIQCLVITQPSGL